MGRVNYADETWRPIDGNALNVEQLAKPLRWKKPRIVLIDGGLFDSLTNEQIAAVVGVIAATPHITYLSRTQHARWMREWFWWIADVCDKDTGFYLCEAVSGALHGRLEGRRVVVDHPWFRWPLANWWPGVSVENQVAADERIPELLQCPAAVRWVSAELIGPVDVAGGHGGGDYLGDRHDDSQGAIGIDWVVAGCESGKHARPCEVPWLRSLRDQCREASVPLWLKQARGPGVEMPRDVTNGIAGTPGMVKRDPSNARLGTLIDLPYLDGIQHASRPEVSRGMP